MPDWLEPMAATLTADRFIDPAWTFERKLDGIRVLAYKDGRDVQLWSRNRLSVTQDYPSVVSALASLAVKNAIFDGEATRATGARNGIAASKARRLSSERAVTGFPLSQSRSNTW